jgi:hypothetical protein
MVNVMAGEEKVVYTIHKDLLCYHSPYFHRALNGSFVDASRQEVELENVQPDVFGLFVHWIYRAKIGEKRFNDPKDSTIVEQTTDEQLIKLWSLADYLQVPKLQNAVVEHMWLRLEELGVHPSIATCKYVYENWAAESLIRRFMVFLCAGHVHDNYIRDLPPEMVLDLALFLNVKYGETAELWDESESEVKIYLVNAD